MADEKENEQADPKPDKRTAKALLRILRFKHQMDSEPKEKRVAEMFEGVMQRVEREREKRGAEKESNDHSR